MNHPIIIKPKNSIKILTMVMMLLCAFVVILGVVLEKPIFSYIGAFIALCYLFCTNHLRYTLIMDQEGCTIKLNFMKKTYKWNEFQLIAHEKYLVSAPHQEALLICTNRIKKSHFRTASQFCFLNNVRKRFYVYLEDEVDIRKTKYISYPKRELLKQLETWGVVLEIPDDIYETKKEIYEERINEHVVVRQTKKDKEWIIETESGQTQVLFVPHKTVFKNHRLFVNGQEIHLSKEEKFLFGYEYKIKIDGILFRFASVDGTCGVVYNGFYIRNNREVFFPPREVTKTGVYVYIILGPLVWMIFNLAFIGVMIGLILFAYLVYLEFKMGIASINARKDNEVKK